MGELYLDGNNHIVIETNNGKIDFKGEHVNIDGCEDFTIKGKDAAVLLSLVNSQGGVKSEQGVYKSGVFYSIISKDEAITLLTQKLEEQTNCYKEENKKLQEKLEKVEYSYWEALGKIDRMRERIKKINRDAHLFWRPLEIED